MERNGWLVEKVYSTELEGDEGGELMSAERLSTWSSTREPELAVDGGHSRRTVIR
jgi:hypothetical protein